MKLRIMRAAVAVAILALAMMTPLLSDLDGRPFGDLTRASELFLDRRPDAIVFAQDDDDDDDDDDLDL